MIWTRDSVSSSLWLRGKVTCLIRVDVVAIMIMAGAGTCVCSFPMGADAVNVHSYEHEHFEYAAPILQNQLIVAEERGVACSLMVRFQNGVHTSSR